jgi:hypothetical protein
VASGLLCLYLAVMSGHLSSIDGLVMWRQALALAYHQSFALVPSIWWGDYLTSSSRGIGASLQYFPGLFVFGWLVHPASPQPGAQYQYALLYSDRLYTIGGAPVWAIVTATSAYLVGLTTRTLGFTIRASLWAMAFYGLGSPAFAASRGDTLQPLVAFCWIVVVFACVRFNQTQAMRWLWICAATIAYGVLTRPLEGSLLLPGAIALLALPLGRSLGPAALQVGGWAVAVVATLLLNWERFGSPLNFGYRLGTPEASWTTPIWVGLPGALVSPGRGVLWEFPALILAVLGTGVLWRRERVIALVMAGLPIVLFLEACQFTGWVGGWDWGFRFFQPALPLVAVAAGIGAVHLSPKLQPWLPALLLTGGVIWNIPAIATDILGGYGSAYATPAANYSLDAYPPIGAWRFLHHLRPQSASDGAAVDIVWLRATRIAGWSALIPFGVLTASAVTFWGLALRAQAGGGLVHAKRTN